MLGDALCKFREQSGLTQGSLADKALLSVPTIRHLEKGFGSLQSFAKLLDALELQLTGRNLPPGPSIGHQLAALRKRRALSQRKLAELLSTTQPTIVSIERHSKGRLSVLDRMLTALGAGPVLLPRGTSLPFYASAANASVVHNWQTPKDLLERLYLVFGPFDLDPCSPTHDRSKAPVKARIHFTQQDDGLSLPWHGTVFLNPPYGRELPRWIAKARAEVSAGRAKTAVALIPARTDTGWWHNDIARLADIFFLRGRLRFGDGVQSAPFPSALAVWGAELSTVESLKESLPPCWHQPPDNRESLFP
jgi:phage N-6-adenine-methyltransferase